MPNPDTLELFQYLKNYVGHYLGASGGGVFPGGFRLASANSGQRPSSARAGERDRSAGEPSRGWRAGPWPGTAEAAVTLDVTIGPNRGTMAQCLGRHTD